MHIQQKAFPKHTDTTKNSYTTSKKNSTPTKPPRHQTSFNHKAHYLPNATNSIFATKNTAPTTHHNTKLYIISSYASIAGGKSKGGKLWLSDVAVAECTAENLVLIKLFTRASVAAYLIGHRLINVEVYYDE